MNIAFVVPGFSADENDWCIPAHTDIVRELARKHTVHVFAMRYPHRVDTYAIGNATVHSFNGVGSRGLASARLWKNVLQSIAREHRRARFDVVHAIFGGEAGSVAVLAGRLLRVPSVVWLVNGELVGRREIGYGADLIARQRWMNAAILNYADCLLCGCAQMVRTARTRNPNARVDCLPLGVNLQRFARVPSAHANARFVNVGSLLPVKDQSILLRALALAADKLPHAQLTIAGVGPLENELRALARELNLAARVTFAGNVPHDELAALYQNAAVFVQASRHEGQGMAALEAGACGCALAGTHVGALADLARGGGAITCAVGDANALAETMRRAYTDRVALGERSRQMVESEYNLTHICARLEGVYAR